MTHDRNHRHWMTIAFDEGFEFTAYAATPASLVSYIRQRIEHCDIAAHLTHCHIKDSDQMRRKGLTVGM